MKEPQEVLEVSRPKSCLKWSITGSDQVAQGYFPFESWKPSGMETTPLLPECPHGEKFILITSLNLFIFHLRLLSLTFPHRLLWRACLHLLSDLPTVYWRVLLGYPSAISSQRIIERFGLKENIEDHLVHTCLPWTGTSFTRPGCSKSCPKWPWIPWRGIHNH